MRIFIIEDESHSEWAGEFQTLEEAIAELRRLANIPWDQEPNRAPCMGWEKCGRRYEIIEYDNSTIPWNMIRCIPALHIRASGVNWQTEF